MAKDYTNDELAEWFRDKALSTKNAGVIRNRILDASERQTDVSDNFVGSMYFFRYDPKHKATLPMYDKYPLVIVIDRYNDGFLGLNLHYLTRGQRGSMVRLFNDFYTKRKLVNGIISGSAKSNWNLIQSATTGVESYSRECVKRYLYNHIRSQIIRINKDEYDKAVQLPIDEWVIKR
jgi:hypothetical protein